MNKEHIKNLHKVKDGLNITFSLGENFYYYNNINQTYFEYIPGKNSATISRENLVAKIDNYLRKCKLEEIMKKI
jgi:hypothetical protein